MSEPDNLDQKRDEIIKQIKQVFPKRPPGKGNKNFKVTNGKMMYEQRKLIEIFEGKNWEDMLSIAGVVYEMSDVDFTRAMTDKAYLYYFPAFLIATLSEPAAWVFTFGAFEKMYNLLPQFSLIQLDVFITYLEYQIEYRQMYGGGTVYELEDLLLSLLFRRDELTKDKAN